MEGDGSLGELQRDFSQGLVLDPMKVMLNPSMKVMLKKTEALWARTFSHPPSFYPLCIGGSLIVGKLR